MNRKLGKQKSISQQKHKTDNNKLNVEYNNKYLFDNLIYNSPKKEKHFSTLFKTSRKILMTITVTENDIKPI